jgi:hypothetical protein
MLYVFSKPKSVNQKLCQPRHECMNHEYAWALFLYGATTSKFISSYLFRPFFLKHLNFFLIFVFPLVFVVAS